MEGAPLWKVKALSHAVPPVVQFVIEQVFGAVKKLISTM
jgi:hypothetical protein